VHRAEFHTVLLRRLAGNTRTHVNKALVAYSARPDGALQLRFAGGGEAQCDVLVGADGVRSAVRAQMLETQSAAADDAQASELRACIPPSFSGATSYRTVVPREKLEAIAPDHPVLSSGRFVRCLHLRLSVAGLKNMSAVSWKEQGDPS
jgi:salicylate hydroxylase